MQQYFVEIKRAFMVLGILSAVFCLDAFILNYTAAIPGYAVGVLTGIGTAVMLYKQVAKIVQMPQEEAIAYAHSGWWMRFGVALFVLTIAFFTSYVSFAATFIGWLSAQIALIISAISAMYKRV
jgi:hypothetical protein